MGRMTEIAMGGRPTRAVLRYLREDRASTATEYALVASLIAIGLVVALTSIGTSVGELFASVLTGFN